MLTGLKLAVRKLDRARAVRRVARWLGQRPIRKGKRWYTPNGRRRLTNDEARVLIEHHEAASRYRIEVLA